MFRVGFLQMHQLDLVFLSKLAVPALVWLFRPFTFSVTINPGSVCHPVFISYWSPLFSVPASPISWVFLMTPPYPSVGSSAVTVLPSGLD